MTTIVTYPGPGYYPAMLADVINAAWTEAIARQQSYDTKIANATTGWLDNANPPTIAATTVAVPTVTPPAATDTVTDAVLLYDTKYQQLITVLDAKFSAFIATHFPDDATAYADVEAWLIAEMANPDRVLPASLANIIWNEDRGRILADAARASNDIAAQWAAKGYPLPPGAAVHATLQVNTKAQEELAKSSRNVATKTFEMAYDKLKFVVEKIVAMRPIALSSALDYIKSMAVAPTISTQLVDAGYGVESKLRSAAAQYYNSTTEAQKLTYAASEYNAKAVQGAAERNQASELQMIDARLKALLAEAAALAQMATSLFNNIHASTGVSASDSVSTSL
jgi:hypothetical protein